MSDKARPPGSPPARIILTPDGRKPSVAGPQDLNRPSLSTTRAPLPHAAPSNHTSGAVIVLSPPRPTDIPLQPAPSTLAGVPNAQKSAGPTAQSASVTSTSGRPNDVHSDVQMTSTVSPLLIAQPASNSVGIAPANSGPAGRQVDVHNSAIQYDVISDRAPSQKRSRKPKKKTALDERGRFRHTVRLDSKTEQKLRMVAEILGVDMNGAISVCVSVHYHRLTKAGGGDI